ncbi:MAG: hypothetical protein KAX16_01990 [Actinomycetia bacterium]|nr:hypothetical protein [Actinomycetes bacterium]
MILSSEVVILGAALGSVVFLFVTDHLFRKREQLAEEALEKIKEKTGTQVYLELNEEGDEANLAA